MHVFEHILMTWYRNCVCGISSMRTPDARLLAAPLRSRTRQLTTSMSNEDVLDHSDIVTSRSTNDRSLTIAMGVSEHTGNIQDELATTYTG